MSEPTKGKTSEVRKTLSIKRIPTKLTQLQEAEKLRNICKREHSYSCNSKRIVSKQISLGSGQIVSPKENLTSHSDINTLRSEVEMKIEPIQPSDDTQTLLTVPENSGTETFLRCKQITQLQPSFVLNMKKNKESPVLPGVTRPENRRVYIPKRSIEKSIVEKPTCRTIPITDQFHCTPSTSAEQEYVIHDIDNNQNETIPEAIVLSSEDESSENPRDDLLGNVDISEIYLADMLEEQKLVPKQQHSGEKDTIGTYYVYRKCGLKHFINEVYGITLDEMNSIGEPIVLNSFDNIYKITMHQLVDSKFIIIIEEETFKNAVDKRIYVDFIKKIFQYDIPNSKLNNKLIRLYYLLEENVAKKLFDTNDMRELNTAAAMDVLSNNNFPPSSQYHRFKRFQVYVHPIAYPKKLLERSEHFRRKGTYLFQFTYNSYADVLMTNLKHYHIRIINYILGKDPFKQTYYSLDYKGISSNLTENSLKTITKYEIDKKIFKSIPLLEQINTCGIFYQLSVLKLGLDKYLARFVGITRQSKIAHVRALRKLFSTKEMHEKSNRLECLKSSTENVGPCIMVPGVCIACNYEFQTQAQYFRHYSETGHSQLMRRCTLCKVIFESEKALKEHLLAIHLQKDFICFVCKNIKDGSILCSEHCDVYLKCDMSKNSGDAVVEIF